jgi:hypothetical protein
VIKAFSLAVSLAGALSLADCGSLGGLGFHPQCDPAHNGAIDNPGNFVLYMDGGPLSGQIGDSDAGDTVEEYDTCHGIASVDFQKGSSGGESYGDYIITPLSPGTCKVTFNDTDECVTVGLTVYPGLGIPSATARRTL